MVRTGSRKNEEVRMSSSPVVESWMSVVCDV